MIIRVSELADQPVTVTDVAALAPALTEASWRLQRVALQVEADGSEVSVRGQVAVTVPQTCGRCLETVPALVDLPVDVRLLPRPALGDSVELGANDLDVDFYDDDALDLARVVEAETRLALPMKPLCREDCRGLCPVCGINRNTGQCACAPRPPDPRLAALRDLAARRDN